MHIWYLHGLLPHPSVESRAGCCNTGRSSGNGSRCPFRKVSRNRVWGRIYRERASATIDLVGHIAKTASVQVISRIVTVEVTQPSIPAVVPCIEIMVIDQIVGRDQVELSFVQVHPLVRIRVISSMGRGPPRTLLCGPGSYRAHRRRRLHRGRSLHNRCRSC